MSQKTILITGCSSGIGYHAAHALAARGWHVIATCRKQEDCDQLVAEGLESLRLDYQETESITDALVMVMELTGGRLDAVFHNGAYAMGGAIEDIPTDAWRRMFEANFFGWHELTRRVIPFMRRQGHGRIVMCSSVLGFIGARMRGPYVSTKFAVEGYADVLRLELRGTNIYPILIEPGPVTSKIRQNAQAHYELWTEKEDTPWAEFYKTTLEPRLYAEDGKKDRFELGPEAVTKKLIHALEAPRPRVRYYVTTPTYIAGYLKRIVPARWLDWVLMKG
ncbi:MAG: SDR family NAD(P)-dependent oxidoreductase [Pseudomonadota bacterium]